jgi:hypothetical protein
MKKRKGKTACRYGADCTFLNCIFLHPYDYHKEEVNIPVEEEENEEEEETVTYHIASEDFPPLSAPGSNTWY